MKQLEFYNCSAKKEYYKYNLVGWVSSIERIPTFEVIDPSPAVVLGYGYRLTQPTLKIVTEFLN